MRTKNLPRPEFPTIQTPRLLDVAQRAGVSPTTASQCFSGKRHVAPATRTRVWRAAVELGYRSGEPQSTIAILLRPPETVRAARSGTTSFSELAGALAMAALSKGYKAVTARDIDEVVGHVPRLDGVVLVAPNHGDDALHKVLEWGIPAASYDPDPGDLDFKWWVGPAYSRSMSNLLQHMNSGHDRRIALIVGGTDNMYRRAVISTYMEDLGNRGYPPLLRLVTNDRGRAGAQDMALSLLKMQSPPDAIITTSSIFAAGVLDAAEELSIPVPQALSIATTTDGPLAQFAKVPITGLHIDAHRLSEAIMEVLECRIQGRPPPRTDLGIDLLLIRRLSTQSS